MSVFSPTLVADSVDGSPPPAQNSPLDCAHREFPILLRRYRLGLALFLAAVAMMFVGFSSAYVVRRGIPSYDAAAGAYSATWEPLRLPLGLLLWNSCGLVSASAAMEMVRRRTRTLAQLEANMGGAVRFWANASLLLSAAFVLGQGAAWHALRSSGHFLNSGARTAFFYVLTGTHALHALLGVLAVAWIAIAYARMSPLVRNLVVDLTAWYLHSMSLLWMYLLGFLLFA